ncbi:hypothetical protein ACRXCV_05045 [Halobacteriovorax sp. GFR7]|uniref:hypothetical protein n=1 Tax=unclassified Halobacteriovorax TaxID=2639665 RepID=UPI003D97793F
MYKRFLGELNSKKVEIVTTKKGKAIKQENTFLNARIKTNKLMNRAFVKFIQSRMKVIDFDLSKLIFKELDSFVGETQMSNEPNIIKKKRVVRRRKSTEQTENKAVVVQERNVEEGFDLEKVDYTLLPFISEGISERDKAIITLRAVGNFSYSKICKTLNISRSTLNEVLKFYKNDIENIKAHVLQQIVEKCSVGHNKRIEFWANELRNIHLELEKRRQDPMSLEDMKYNDLLKLANQMEGKFESLSKDIHFTLSKGFKMDDFTEDETMDFDI